MNDSLKNNVVSLEEHCIYRQAADRVWEMAKEYEKLGLIDLSNELKDIATEIHNVARKKFSK